MRAEYVTQPFEVSLETLTLCNANCTFCPYSELDRIGKKMSDELIDKLLSEMSTWKSEFFISPFKVNEPLIDPRLIGLLKRIETEIPKARMRLFTNGTTLTPRNTDAVGALTRLEHLWVSLNASDEIDHQKLMRFKRPMFETICENLDRMHADDYPQIVVLSRVADNPDKNREFIQYCLKRWPKFKPVIIKRDGWLGFVEPGSPFIPNMHCSRWFELSVLSDGRVSLCCMDGKGQFEIGNVNEQTLLEVYNDPRRIERRQSLTSRKKIYPCSTCTY